MSNDLKVRCLLCGDRLAYSRDSTELLIGHLKAKHPYIRLARLPAYQNSNDLIFQQLGGCQKSNLNSPSKCSNKNEDGKNEKMTFPENTKFDQGNAIVCPSCGKTGPPLAKKQKAHLTENMFGTCLLLGCWPLCFLPFLIGGNNNINLYCTHCSYYLGTFDRKLNMIVKRNDNAEKTKLLGNKNKHSPQNSCSINDVNK